MASVILFQESISGAQAGAPAESGYEVRRVRKSAAAIPPAVFVCRSTQDYDCKVPTTIAEVLACIGLTILADTIELVTGSYPANKAVPLFSKAPAVWVNTEAAAVEDGQVYVRYAGSGQLGGITSAYIAGETYPLPGCKFRSTQATPAGLVKIEFSLPASMTPMQDFGGGKGFVDVVVDLASIPANTAPDQSTAVAGSLVGDVFAVTSLTALTVGSVICEARCRVAGTVVWRVANVTVGAIDNASNTFRFSLVSRG